MKNIQGKTISSFILIALLLSALNLQSHAQTAYKQTADSYITISGTSTLHNWTMTSLEAQYQATFENGPEGSLTQLKALSLTIASQTLKSEHSAMDKNAYSSLKTDKHKTIAFNLTTASVEKSLIKCSGNLAIAGVTKLINVDAICQAKPDMSLRCTGSKAFKMSDFQVEPPTFMFGTVKTGDDITISFNVELAQVKN